MRQINILLEDLKRQFCNDGDCLFAAQQHRIGEHEQLRQEFWRPAARGETEDDYWRGQACETDAKENKK